MNLLYISPMVIDYDNLDGVARKILFQKEAFEKSPQKTIQDIKNILMKYIKS